MEKPKIQNKTRGQQLVKPHTVTDPETLKEFQHTAAQILRQATELRSGSGEKQLDLLAIVTSFAKRYKRGVNANRIIAAVCDAADALVKHGTLISLHAAETCCFMPIIEAFQIPDQRDVAYDQFPRELIRALLSSSDCQRSYCKLSDPFIREQQTFKQLTHGALGRISVAQDLLARLDSSEREERYWQILNSSILSYKICEPLVTLGVHGAVPKHLSRTIVAMESVLCLKTAKYLSWRTKVYVLLANSYIGMHTASSNRQECQFLTNAKAVASRLVSQCNELETIEREELPIPATTMQAIDSSRETAKQLISQIDQMNNLEVKSNHDEVLDDAKQNDTDAPMNESKEEVVASSKPSIDVNFLQVLVHSLKGTYMNRNGIPDAETRIATNLNTFYRELQQVPHDQYPLLCVIEVCELSLLVGELQHVPMYCKAILAIVESNPSSCAVTSMTPDILVHLAEIFYRVYLLESGDVEPLNNPVNDKVLVDPSEQGMYPGALAQVEGRDIRVSDLHYLSEDVISCATGVHRNMIVQRPDFFSGIATRLWNPYITAVLASIGSYKADSSVQISESLFDIAIQVLNATAAICNVLNVDDPILRAQLSLRLAHIWGVAKKDPSRSIQVLHRGIQQLKSSLTQWSTKSHDSVSQSIYSLSSLPAFSQYLRLQRRVGASHLANVSEPLDLHGVLGDPSVSLGRSNTHAQLESLLADMTVMYFKAELERAYNLDLVQLTKLQSQRKNRSKVKSGKRQPNNVSVATENTKETEGPNVTNTIARLLRKCDHNMYETALFQCTYSAFVSSPQVKAETLNDALMSVCRAGAKEAKFVAAQDILNVQLQAIENNAQSVPIVSKDQPLPAPICVTRSCSRISLAVSPFKLEDSRDGCVVQPAYLILFGKDAKSGKTVSEHNRGLKGCGIQVPFHPNKATTFHVSELTENKAYVFAICAYDRFGNQLCDIGKPSICVEAVTTFPLTKCLGDICTSALSPVNNAQASDGQDATGQTSSLKHTPEEVECHRLGKLAYSILHQYFVSDLETSQKPFTEPLKYYELRSEVVANSPPFVLHTFVQAMFCATSTAFIHSNIPYGGLGAESELETIPYHSITDEQVRLCKTVQKLYIAGELAVILDDADSVLESVAKAFKLTLLLLECDTIESMVLHVLLSLHHFLFLIPMRSWNANVAEMYSRLCYQIIRITTRIGERKVLVNIIQNQIHNQTLQGTGGASYRVETSMLENQGDQVTQEQRSLWMLLSGRPEFINPGLSIVHATSLSSEVPATIQNDGEQHRDSREALWESVHQSLARNSLEEAWKALDGDEAESHPMYLYMICLVCQRALDTGLGRATDWARDIQELFHDLKARGAEQVHKVALEDDIEGDADQETSSHVESENATSDQVMPPSETLSSANAGDDNESRTGETENIDQESSLNDLDANETTTGEIDNEIVTREVEPFQESASSCLLRSLEADNGSFLCPLSKLVMHQELDETSDPLSSILEHQSYPAFQNEERNLPSSRVELLSTLVRVAARASLGDREQLGALAELELLRARGSYEECARVFATKQVQVSVQNSRSTGPLVDTLLFLQTLEQDVHAESPSIDFNPSLTTISLTILENVPATLHLCGRSATRALWARNWNQVRIAGKLAWNSILLAWVHPSQVSDNAVCEKVLNPRVRKKLLQAKAESRMLKQGFAIPQENTDLEASPPLLVPRIAVRTPEGITNGDQPHQLVSLDWRPMWRIVISLFEMIEEVVSTIRNDEVTNIQEVAGSLGQKFSHHIETTEGHDTMPDGNNPGVIDLSLYQKVARLGANPHSPLEKPVILAALQSRNIRTLWIFHFVRFLSESLFCLERYQLVVLCCDRFNAATCDEYAMELLPLMIRAQRLLYQRASSDRSLKEVEMNSYEQEWKEAHRKKKRRYVKKAKAALASDVSPQVAEAHANCMHDYHTQVESLKRVEMLLKTALNNFEQQLSDLERDEQTSKASLRLARQLVDESLSGLSVSVGNKSARSARSIRSVQTHIQGGNGLRVPGGISTYTKLVTALQQKQEQHLLVQAYVDLGDLQHASGYRGGISSATQSWSSAIDASFSRVDTLKHWKEMLVELAHEWRKLAPHGSGDSEHDLSHDLIHDENSNLEEDEDKLDRNLNEALDRALGVGVRTSTTKDAGELGNFILDCKVLLNGEYPAEVLYRKVGLYECLMAGIAAVRVARAGNQKLLQEHQNCLLFASFLFQGAISGSLHIPKRLHELALYTTSTPFPTMNALCDQQRVPPSLLIESLKYLIMGLLSSVSVSVALRGLPAIVLYEYVATHLTFSATHAINARLLRAQLLLKVGMIHEAVSCATNLMLGKQVPGIREVQRVGHGETAEDTTNGADGITADDAVANEGDVQVDRSTTGEDEDSKSTGRSDASENAETTAENDEVPSVVNESKLHQFHNNLLPYAPENIKTLEWLLNLNGIQPIPSISRALGISGSKKLQTIRVGIVLQVLELWRDSEPFVASHADGKIPSSVRQWEKLVNRTGSAIKMLFKLPVASKKLETPVNQSDNGHDENGIAQNSVNETMMIAENTDIVDSESKVPCTPSKREWQMNPLMKLTCEEYLRRHLKLSSTSTTALCSQALDDLGKVNDACWTRKESNHPDTDPTYGELDSTLQSYWDSDGTISNVVGTCHILDLRLEVVRLLLDQRHLEDALAQCQIGVENCKSVGTGNRLVEFQEQQIRALMLSGKQEEAYRLLMATIEFHRTLGVLNPDCLARLLVLMVEEFQLCRTMLRKRNTASNEIDLQLHGTDIEEATWKAIQLCDALSILRTELKCVGYDYEQPDKNCLQKFAKPTNKFFKGYLDLANVALLLVRSIRKCKSVTPAVTELSRQDTTLASNQVLLLLDMCKDAIDISTRWNPQIIAREGLERGVRYREMLKAATEYRDEIEMADKALQVLGDAVTIATKHSSHDFETIVAISFELVLLCGQDLGYSWSDRLVRQACFWFRFASRALQSRRLLLVDASESSQGENSETGSSNSPVVALSAKLRSDVRDLELRCAQSTKDSCYDLKKIVKGKIPSRRRSSAQMVRTSSVGLNETDNLKHHTLYHLFSLLGEGRKSVVGNDLRVLEFSCQAQQFLARATDPRGSMYSLIKPEFLVRQSTSDQEDGDTPDASSVCISMPESQKWLGIQWHESRESVSSKGDFVMLAMCWKQAEATNDLLSENGQEGSVSERTHKFVAKTVPWSKVRQTRRALQRLNVLVRSALKVKTIVEDQVDDEGGEGIGNFDDIKLSEDAKDVYENCLSLVSDLFACTSLNNLNDDIPLPHLTLAALDVLNKAVDVGLGVDMAMDDMCELWRWLTGIIFPR